MLNRQSMIWDAVIKIKRCQLKGTCERKFKQVMKIRPAVSGSFNSVSAHVNTYWLLLTLKKYPCKVQCLLF